MTRRALVLRPEPGNAETAARLTALGMDVRRCPLFVVTPVAWMTPDPGDHDAVLLTSANAVRHAGSSLHVFADLPLVAVGEATAAAAQAAGLRVALTGDSDAHALVDAAQASGFRRLLHLAGRDRVDLPGVDQITVYASDATPIDAAAARSWAGDLALLHSRRAARRFAGLIDRAGVDRSTIAVAALSPSVADAAGGGWAALAAAAAPDDRALAALALALIDRPSPPADKRDE